MSRFVRIIAVLFISLMFFNAIPAFGEGEKEETEWTGKLSDGTVITVEDLWDIFKEQKKLDEIHNNWLKALKQGNYELSERLREEYLSITLRGADLRNVNLAGADLEKVVLARADLSGADLEGANLQFVFFAEVDLSRSNLSRANLQDASIWDSNLSEADLKGANLNQANLNGVRLVQAKMQFSILTNANLHYADLRQANMQFVDLSEANLDSADLRGADLYGAILNNADLSYTKGLPELLKNFKRDRDFDNSRLINYFIAENGSLLDSLFFMIFWYWVRPFWLILVLICFIPIFAVSYIFALKCKRPKTGIWLILKKDRQSKAIIKERPFKLTTKYPWRTIPLGKLGKINLAWWRRLNLAWLRWDRMIRIGLYFSLLSAFNIGWKNVNTNGLITRLQRRDYSLRATGWVRSLSGIQSLLSIFLLALWAFTVFVQSSWVIF